MSEFENFEDDFAVEGEEQQASSPFLPLAGLLIAILVLTVICAAIVWFVQGPGQGGNGDQDQAFNATSTAVAIANATTLASPMRAISSCGPGSTGMCLPSTAISSRACLEMELRLRPWCFRMEPCRMDSLSAGIVR